MNKPQEVVVTGRMPNDFANEIVAALDAAQKRGIELDVAVCIAAGVIADYARAEYGDGYLDDLAYVLKQRAGKPFPRAANLPGK